MFKKYFHYVYLLLSLFGGGFTYYYVMKGVADNAWTFNIPQFVYSTWTNDAFARSITLDFWTGATAGTLFMLIEGVCLQMKRFWIYIVCTFLIGFAFAFPLFLFMRHQLLMKRMD
jgi:hypothetical protein